MTDVAVEERPRNIFSRLYHGETRIDFMRQRRRWFFLSLLVIVIGLGALLGRGLNLSIDFQGGTVWEVPTGRPSVSAARDALRPLGLAESTIQVVGQNVLRVEANPEAGSDAELSKRRQEISAVLAKSQGASASAVGVSQVGPTWGGEITNKAVRALVVFLIVVSLYIALRFEWKMALAALAALFHDILITVGIYSLSGFEVTPATVIAFLTILGYSLYDTIVVFDKVEENTKGLAASGRMTYADTVNLSMNQTLMRSLNTSLVAVLPVLAVLVIGAFVLGATTLQDFGLALLIGLLTGAYSSIFIASPILAILKEREPRYQAIRQRLEARSGGAATVGPLVPSAAAVGSIGDGVGERRPLTTGPARVQPRPRKKRRR